MNSSIFSLECYKKRKRPAKLQGASPDVIGN